MVHTIHTNGTRQADAPNVAAMFRELKTEYDAAKTDSVYRRPVGGVNWLGSSADYHTRFDHNYLKIVEGAYNLARNDTVVGALVRRGVQNVLRSGYGYRARTGDAVLDEAIDADLREWATTPSMCDASARFTLHDLANQTMFADEVSGDSFILPRSSGTLQMVEGYRCRTPRSGDTSRIVLGVERDGNRRPIAYWFIPDDLDPLREIVNLADPTRYPACDANGNEQVWHIFDAQRYSQTRGISSLAPIFDTVGLFSEIQFALLTKQQVQACIAIMEDAPLGGPGGPPKQLGERTTTTRSDGSTEIKERLSPGQRYTSKPGGKLSGFAPGITTVDDLEFLKFTLHLIASAVDIPLISYMLDGRETNFSGWRGAIEQAKIGWKNRQQRYRQQFYQRAYRFRLEWLVSTSPEWARVAARVGQSFYRGDIDTPRWPYIEPNKDIAAAGLELEKLQTSPRRQAQERGFDLRENRTEIVADNAETIRIAAKAALELRNELGIDVELSRLLYLDGKTEIGRLPQNESKPAQPALPPPPEPAQPQSNSVTVNVAAPQPPDATADHGGGEADVETNEDRSAVHVSIDTLSIARETGVNPRLEQYAGPWMIRPEAHRMLRSIAERTDLRAHLAHSASVDMDEDERGAMTTADGTVAVLPITGTLTKYGSSMFGGTSTLRAQRALRCMLDDDRIEHIVALIDSPGGSALGVPDLGDDIYRGRSRKPITAMIEGQCCSGGWWLASQCGEVYASPHAWVGSMGAFVVVTDISEAEREAGVKTLVVRSAEYKALGLPGEVIDDKVLADAQSEIDAIHADFVASVARGRGRDAGEVMEWADGKVHLAPVAMSMGMVDGLTDFSALLEMVGQPKLSEPAQPAMMTGDQQ
jgi:signal peptide peptidase SppA